MIWIKRFLVVIRVLLIAVFLTIVTQIGGVLYLLLKPLGIFIKKKEKGWKGFLLRMSMYFFIYFIISLTVVPKLALKYNRVPLPYFASEQIPLKPARLFFCLANRHYVRSGLYTTIVNVSQGVSQQYPGTELSYLDANFPLFKYFPLLPHKSHNDGRRLDLSFLYKDSSEKRLLQSPGVLGYGYCEIPQKGEINWPDRCAKKGYRFYSMLYNITNYFQSNRFHFDKSANQFLLREIAKQKKIRKIFIEPHLKVRLGLEALGKIRFHGCGAVRHDDHVHVEI